MPLLSYRTHLGPTFRKHYLEDPGYHKRLARLDAALEELRTTDLSTLTTDAALRILDEAEPFARDFKRYCAKLDRRANASLPS